MTPPDEFLSGLYDTAAVSAAAAQDAVYDTLALWLSAGRHRDVDAVLSRADFTRLPSAVRRSILCVASWDAGSLPSYPAAAGRAVTLLTAEKGEAYARRVLGPFLRLVPGVPA